MTFLQPRKSARRVAPTIEPVAATPGDFHSPVDEVALVEGLRRGDDAAYETLLRTHGPRMLAVARGYLPAEEADDVVQSAFVLVVRFIRNFEGASRLGTWLHRIVVNCALMRIRSRGRHPEAKSKQAIVEGESTARLAARIAAPGRDEISRRETHELLQGAIRRLPDTVRAAVRLHDVDGLTLAETSHLLGRSASAVKTSLHRGRVALRVMLVPTGGSPSYR